jgi:hypothetical protein
MIKIHSSIVISQLPYFFGNSAHTSKVRTREFLVFEFQSIWTIDCNLTIWLIEYLKMTKTIWIIEN